MLVEPVGINIVQVVVCRHDNGNLLPALVSLLALRRRDGPVLLGVRLLGPRLVVCICRLVLLPDGRQCATYSRAGGSHPGGDGPLRAVEELLRARGAPQGRPAGARRVYRGKAGVAGA